VNPINVKKPPGRYDKSNLTLIKNEARKIKIVKRVNSPIVLVVEYFFVALRCVVIKFMSNIPKKNKTSC
jgi:hypothetical protein